MWYQDFSKNWKFELQQKIQKLSLNDLKKENIYLESSDHYAAFLLDIETKEIVRLTGSYEIQDNHCLVTSFERDTDSALSKEIKVEFVLPFFLLFQHLYFQNPGSSLKCRRDEMVWIVESEDLQADFRTELAAKAAQYGVPLKLAVCLDGFSEANQKSFFEIRSKSGTLPMCFRKLGVSWLSKLLPALTTNSDQPVISKKFS